MKVICALLVLLSFGKSYAQLLSRASCEPYLNIQKTTSTLTCNNKDTVFIYINGVNNSETAAQDGLDKLIELSLDNLIHDKKDNPTSKLIPNFIYNFSFVPSDGLILGLYKDIVEAMAQKLITDFNVPTNEAWQISFNVLVDGPKNLTEQLIARMLPPALPLIGLIEYFYLSDEFEDFKRILIETNTLDTVKIKSVILSTLTNKQKMIVVSHSQGGLFVNQAWKELNSQGNSYFINGKRWYTNLQIATPASSNLPNKGGFLTNNDDFAALIAIRSNMTGTESIAPGVNPDKIDSYLHHNLDTTYLSSSYPGYRDCAANAIIDAAEQLESNCSEQCVDPESQIVYEAIRHVNPDGSEGGIVALNSEVDSSVEIGSGSVVCGSSIVKGNVKLTGEVFVMNSTLNGSDGGVYVYGGAFPDPDLGVPSANEPNFNGWGEANVTIRDSEVVSSGDGIDIVNSYVHRGKVYNEALIMAGVLNNGVLKDKSSIEGGEADAFYAPDLGLPQPEIIISGESVIKGTVVTQTKTLLSDSFLDKKGLIIGNASIIGSDVAGLVVGYDTSVISSERPAAEVSEASLGELGGIFLSGKLLNDATMGFVLSNLETTGQSFIFDKAIARDGVGIINGSALSNNAVVTGERVVISRSSIIANAEVNSRIGGGTKANLTVHQSMVSGSARVSGTPYIYQSSIFGSATISGDAQILRSYVGESLSVGGEKMYVCSEERTLGDTPIDEFDCPSSPTPPAWPVPPEWFQPASPMARSIASVEAEEMNVETKLALESEKLKYSQSGMQEPRGRALYAKAIARVEQLRSALNRQELVTKNTKSKKGDEEAIRRERLRPKNHRLVALVKARKNSVRHDWNRWKNKMAKKKS